MQFASDLNVCVVWCVFDSEIVIKLVNTARVRSLLWNLVRGLRQGGHRSRERYDNKDGGRRLKVVARLGAMPG